MTETTLWTVGKLLEWTANYLAQNGSESPRLDAEVLLAHARQCQRIQLYTSFNEEPKEEEKKAFRELVRRRKEGEPVAYLVGSKEFYSLRFLVSPAVLIPRNETEYAVIEVLDRAKEFREGPLRIADVCTGSGCIAVAIAKHQPSAQITALDISPEALKVAQQNISLNQVESQIRLLESDLLSAVPGEQFEIIVSNPPYVSESEYQALAPSVRLFEPKLALVADQDGMAIIERLGKEARDHLVEGGYWIFELSPMLSERVTQWFAQHACWKLDRIVKDLAGHPRIAVAKLLTKE